MILRRDFLTAGFGIALAVALPSCGRSAELGYRMTVEVDTPSGLRKGSSVIRLNIHRGPIKWPNAGATVDISGEAVAVDLPGGKTLFVLLNKSGFPDGAAYIPGEALEPSEHFGKYAAVNRYKEMKAMTKVGVLPPDAYPTFVTFGDPADPMTVKEVNPEDLAATFGEGVSLRRITVQITNAAVTKKIETKLPWVKGHPEESIIPKEYRKNFKEIKYLKKSDFKRG